jgi:hypothetical protein
MRFFFYKKLDSENEVCHNKNHGTYKARDNKREDR